MPLHWCAQATRTWVAILRIGVRQELQMCWLEFPQSLVGRFQFHPWFQRQQAATLGRAALRRHPCTCSRPTSPACDRKKGAAEDLASSGRQASQTTRTAVWRKSSRPYLPQAVLQFSEHTQRLQVE